MNRFSSKAIAIRNLSSAPYQPFSFTSITSQPFSLRKVTTLGETFSSAKRFSPCGTIRLFPYPGIFHSSWSERRIRGRHEYHPLSSADNPGGFPLPLILKQEVRE